MKRDLKNQPRPIIREFFEEIDRVKIEIPNHETIHFRDDKITGKIRKAYKVPIENLRFRKDNGRIASDVLTYENNKGELNEATDYGQAVLKGFLERKDPVEPLANQIISIGQERPAVITCDGFLINGNRRKMTFEKLLEKNPGDIRFRYLKVIILPSPNDNEPIPTYYEIEQIENRFQFQNEGKAEYSSFDKALSIDRKMKLGMDLDEILRDDPDYQRMPDSEFAIAKARFIENYLEPLKCANEYLGYLNRPGHYNTISEGKGDAEGRWQAFIDYYQYVYKTLNNDQKRIKYGIEEDEKGKVQEIAFKIIRKRDLGSYNKKLHQVVRDLPKLLKDQKAKRELFSLLSIDFDLSPEETMTEEGKQVDEKVKDIIWSSKYSDTINETVKQAYRYSEEKREKDTPIDLLNAALDKLTHSNMKISVIEESRIEEAKELLKSIKFRVDELEAEVNDAKKTKKKKP